MIRLRTQKLLSGVSALAALMTFGAAGGAQAGTSTFSGPGSIDAINTQTDTTVSTRDSVTIDGNADVGVDGSGRSFYNPRTTPGLITIGGSSTTGLVINDSTLEGSIVNGGVISSFSNDAVSIFNSVIQGGLTNTGSIFSIPTGLSTADDGIQIDDTDFFGGIHNTLDAEIRAQDDAIVILSGTTFEGGITNAGLIASTSSASGSGTGGTGNGIRIRSGASFSGGITNTVNGEIRGGGSTNGLAAIDVNANSFSGGISNSGLIKGQGTSGVGILVEGNSFTGGITNEATGEIITTGTSGAAIDVQGGFFSGGIVNHGLIDARQNSAVGISVSGLTFEGGISNSGSIYSDSSAAISVSGTQFSGGIQNSGEIIAGSGTGIEVTNGSFAGGITNEEGGLIQGSGDAIAVSSGVSFSGGITNAGLIQSTSSNNAIDINADLFTGGIVNSGSILALASTTVRAAINIRGTSFAGGISNSGLIEGGSTLGAIDITGTSFTGGIQNSGSIIGDGDNAINFGSGTFSDGITNEEGGLINSGSNAIELIGTSFSGGISNAGIIGGTTSGNADIAIHVGTAFQGGITNSESGIIEGSTYGILVNGSSFLGGIHNDGLINTTLQSANRLAIAITAGSFGGGIDNTGTISAHDTVIGISGTSFSGGISNGGLIESTGNAGTAIDFTSGSFTGGISNSGTILGGNIAISLSGATFDGGITNDNTIQTKGTQATAIAISSASFTGGITNNTDGVIQAGQNLGIKSAIILSGASFSGGIVNDGLIQGGTVSGMGIDAGAATFSGGISNTGTMQGADTGLSIHGNSFSGGLNNDGGTIQTTDAGYGVHISSTVFAGGVDNSGYIKGAPGGEGTNGTGLLITSTTFSGGIVNSGTITGDDPGLVVNVTSFSGGVSNSGLIEGTSADGANLSGTTFSGGFVNSGTITGSNDGLDINFHNFNGGFTNTVDGEITGATGARLGGTNFHGDVVNDGSIDGGEGEGLRLAMTLLSGSVTNTGEITASGDALKVTGGTTISGDVANEGTISSSFSDGLDINGVVQGSFSNSGLIEGGTTGSGNGIDLDGTIVGGIVNSGTIRSDSEGAVDLTGEDAAITLTQTAGLISDYMGGEGNGTYAINMVNNFDDVFYANGGVVEGNIYLGSGGEGDNFINQSGTFAWAYGNTFLTGFNEFDVNEDATTVLGAYSRGNTDGGPVHVFANNLAIDGNLYLHDQASLDVETIAQGATGQVEYFLTSNEGQHGAIGVNSAVSNAELAGEVAVYLDGETFADSKFSAQTDFTYTDVLTSTSLSGNFSNAGSITTNSLFFTGESVDNGSDGLDINLHRVDFADVLDTNGETDNQNAVGGALDTIFAGGEFGGDFQDLISALYGNNLTPEEIQAIYDELGGAEHAQLQNTALGLSGVLGTLIGDRLDSTLPGLGGGKMASLAWKQFADGTDGKTASDVTPPSSNGNRGLNTGASGASVWARGYGNWTKADGDTEATGYDQNTGGAALGVDFAVASNATLGLAGGWSTTDVSFDTAGDDATVDTYQGGLYGSVGMGRFYLDGSATYSAHDLSVTRLVDLPGPATPFEATSNYNASAWSLNGEFGSIFRVGRVDLQPSAALAYTSLSTDGFTETGDNDAFNLLVQGSDASSFASTLAVRGSGQFMMGRTRVMPDVKLGWRHEFGDDRQTFTAAFEQDPTVPFEIISSKTAADAAVVNAGITAAVTKSIEVFVDLNGQYSGEVTTSNAAGGVRLTW